MAIQTVVISESENTIDVLKLYLEECKEFNFNAGVSEYSQAGEIIKGLKEVLIIADISQYQEQALNFVAKVKNEYPDVRVITISDKPDINLVIRSMRVGALDFVSVPVLKQEFLNILDKIHNDIKGIQQKKSKCKIISVYSNKGGIGKTAIATNIAVEMAKITKENVALIDFNFEFGDIATFLDLKPNFNITYMAQNIDKLNNEFLLSTMEKYKKFSLYVLSDSIDLKQSTEISLNNIPILFNALRETFSYVILDLSGGFDKKSLKALELSDYIFLPMVVNLPALRNCQRCLEFFEKSGLASDKIKIILNRYMENDEISAEDVENVLGKKVYWKIPNNYFTMMSAINKGIPVSDINPDSNVALSYKNLALMLSDRIYK